jgi:GT2 family glycosyltransferase
MAFPKIAIVVINYRTAQMTLDCLASLEPEVTDLPDAHVFLVDSASGDDSPDLIEREKSAREWNWLSTLRLTKNRGFSAGNNAGMAFADKRDRFDAYLLLNSDTLVRPGAIKALGQVLEFDSSVGLVGPRLEWADGAQQVSCFRKIGPISELLNAAKTGPITRLFSNSEVAIFDPPVRDQPDRNLGGDSSQIDWISFACVLIRRNVVCEIGPMDEGFFMYFEDVDYCLRARNAGWRITYAPSAHVVHLRGGRTPEAFAVEELRRRPGYYYQSRARYLAKYYGRTGPWWANLCWHIGRSVSFARELAGSKAAHTSFHEGADIWRGSLCGFRAAQNGGTKES